MIIFVYKDDFLQISKYECTECAQAYVYRSSSIGQRICPINSNGWLMAGPIWYIDVLICAAEGTIFDFIDINPVFKNILGFIGKQTASVCMDFIVFLEG